MTYYAHTLEGSPPSEWQLLEDHLEKVAELTARHALAFNASDWGRPLGKAHDVGKYRLKFQDKLVKQSSRRVDHKGVGAKLAWESWGQPGKLLSYCIAGHHGGLPNYGHSQTDNSISLRDLLEQASSLPEETPDPFQDISLPSALPFQPKNAFQIAFFTRMLFSALVDADFLDTERFMDPERYAARSSGPPLAKLLHSLNAKLAGFDSQGRINQLRRDILDLCRENADLEPGLFTLTVPTGGGKTLSSMAFALEHAQKYGHRRIIYVIPYTSIIEQNAKVFRDIFPPDTIIEHHSNFDQRSLPEDKDQLGAGLRHRLACENWDAPVVVTTNVQFFESLYASKTSRCRKLHNMAGSVIILDEAQMLPVEYLKPCLRALEELTENYQASVVLCTATQPALKKRDEFKHGLAGVREIAPDPKRMHQEFLRTRLEDVGTLALEDVAELIRDKEQVLCIVNTRTRASDLFDLVHREPGARHLSALMCPAHRSQELKEIREALRAGGPCRVVSTQLVEAGVDVSFPEVIREMAGLDSIAQAAGRCNREAELKDLGRVTVFTPEEGLASAFRQAAGSAQSTLRHYGDDPFAPEAVEFFFSETYWLQEQLLDQKQILEEFKVPLNWAFRDVANRFRLIENIMCPVIIPYNQEAEQLIERLRFAAAPGGVLRELQHYTVQIYAHQLEALDEAGAIEFVDEQYPVLIDKELYSTQQGLKVPKEPRKSEEFIC
jgi:CRISPR-associated endonuclease/helicase Cas3